MSNGTTASFEPQYDPMGGSNKYRIIRQSQYSPKDEKERTDHSHEYASFLKNLERTCGPDGFVDSSHFQYKYRMQLSAPSTETANFKRSLSDGSLGVPKSSIIDVSKANEYYLQEHNDRLKHIQYNMVAAKQTERSLKRMEGSIMKSQQELRRSMRQFEKDVENKRFDEDKKVTEALGKYDIYQRDFQRDVVDTTKRRMRLVQTTEMYEKTQERKSHLNTLQLEGSYRRKLEELQHKRNERARLARDYETKLRLKEEEEIRLNKEIKEVLHALQLQNIKQKQYEGHKMKKHFLHTKAKQDEDRDNEIEMETKLGESGGDLRKADFIEKQLSANLRRKQNHVNIQKRDLQRAIESTRMRLTTTADQQKNLSEETVEVERDRRRHELEMKLKQVEARREDNQTMKSHDRKVASETSEAMYYQKAQTRRLEEERLAHEDSIRHFEHVLQQGESLDHTLFIRLKQAEQAEQLQEQQVRQLSEKKQRLEAKHGKQWNETLKSSFKQEEDTNAKLQLARAELLAKRAEKEFLLGRLRLHRGVLQNDRHLVEEHRKQHSYLSRVAAASENSLNRNKQLSNSSQGLELTSY